MTPFPNGRDNDMNTLRTRYTLLGTFQLLGPALPILFYFNVSPMRGSLHDIPPLRRGVLDAPALVVGSRASMMCRRSCGLALLALPISLGNLARVLDSFLAC